MATRKTSLVSELRERVRQQVAETSLRKTAVEIGLSSSGLHSFLAGTSPHPSTLRKLTRWHVNSAPLKIDDLADKRSALSILMAHLPPRAQRSAELAMLNVLKDYTCTSQVPVPKWLGALLKKTGSE